MTTYGGGEVIGKGFTILGDIAKSLVGRIGIGSNVATILKPLGLGSTRRIIALDLEEQLAMKEIMSNPALGKEIKRMAPLKDPRWPGWKKMQYIKEVGEGGKKGPKYPRCR